LEVRERWVSACGRTSNSNGEPPFNIATARICSIHFDDEFYEKDESSGVKRSRLKPGAVPTLHVPVSVEAFQDMMRMSEEKRVAQAALKSNSHHKLKIVLRPQNNENGTEEKMYVIAASTSNGNNGNCDVINTNSSGSSSTSSARVAAGNNSTCIDVAASTNSTCTNVTASISSTCTDATANINSTCTDAIAGTSSTCTDVTAPTSSTCKTKESKSKKRKVNVEHKGRARKQLKVKVSNPAVADKTLKGRQKKQQKETKHKLTEEEKKDPSLLCWERRTTVEKADNENGNGDMSLNSENKNLQLPTYQFPFHFLSFDEPSTVKQADERDRALELFYNYGTTENLPPTKESFMASLQLVTHEIKKK